MVVVTVVVVVVQCVCSLLWLKKNVLKVQNDRPRMVVVKSGDFSVFILVKMNVFEIYFQTLESF